jgi:hypothetical protein
MSASAWTVPIGSAGGLLAEGGSSRVTVRWKPAEGANAYVVYYWTGKNAAQRTALSNSPAVIQGLVNGTTYSIRVAAANSGVESVEGDTVSATPLAAPDSVAATMLDGGVALSWPAVPGATGYSVYYGEGTVGDTTASKIATKEPKLALGGLTNDVYYALIVRAENGSDHSDPGSTIRALPMKPPAGFSAVGEPDKVTLRWVPVQGATRYNIYYRKGDGVDKSAQQVANAQPGQVVTNLENGELYTFAVEAIKGGVAGPLSEAQSILYVSSTLEVGGGAASDSMASYLSLAVDASDKPYLAYVDQGKTLAERNLPKVVVLGKDGWTPLPRPSAKAPYTCCDLRIGPGQMPYLGMGDAEQGNRITVKVYDGSGWSTVGNAAVTDAKAEFMAMGIDLLGAPYVAYNDSAHTGRVSVRRLEGSKWAQVGLPGFSTNSAGPLSLAFARTGLPLLSSGGSGSFAPSVMAFDGKNWGAAGDVTGALSKAAPGPLPLGVTSGNLAYAAMADRTAGYKVTVLANSGTTWNGVGIPGFSDGSTQEVALAADPNGVPFVAFADDSKGGRVSVMKFAGGAWTHACRAGFSKGRASFVRIAIGPSGTVYVAYQDAGTGGRAQVVKLNAP